MPRDLVVEARARAEIRDALAWWRENRPKAPRALSSELKSTLALIRDYPEVGRRVTGGRSDVYRVPLKRVRYALYYRATCDEVQVLALWHASRGSAPSLR